MTIAPANSHGSGYPLGLTGATAATRYVGGTTSGAPASGTFAVGDFVTGQDGTIFVCTVAGTPGTWVQAGGGGAVSSVFARTGAVVAAEGDYSLGQLSDVTLTSLAAGETLVAGAGPTYVNVPRRSRVMPTGALAESIPRATARDTSGALVSQRLTMIAIELQQGVVCTSATFVSSGTPLAVGVHQIFGIFDDPAGTTSGTPYALLRGSNDDTSTAWGANTAKTLSLTSTYTPTRTGLFYLGILVDAGTVPTLMGAAGTLATVFQLAPIFYGHSNTAITALPNPANAPSTSAVSPIYGYVS